MELFSANSRLFSTTELRLSTIFRDCSPIIYALSEYEILTQGTQHPIFLYTDHKPIPFWFAQKNKQNEFKFQSILLRSPNLHIVWTEGKNLSIPDLLSRSTTTPTQDDHPLRTIESPDSIKILRHTTNKHNQHCVTMLYQKNILTQ